MWQNTETVPGRGKVHDRDEPFGYRPRSNPPEPAATESEKTLWIDVVLIREIDRRALHHGEHVRDESLVVLA